MTNLNFVTPEFYKKYKGNIVDIGSGKQRKTYEVTESGFKLLKGAEIRGTSDYTKRQQAARSNSLYDLSASGGYQFGLGDSFQTKDAYKYIKEEFRPQQYRTGYTPTKTPKDIAFEKYRAGGMSIQAAIGSRMVSLPTVIPNLIAVAISTSPAIPAVSVISLPNIAL